MVKNAFTRAQGHTSRNTSIADAVNIPVEGPAAQAPAMEGREEPAPSAAVPARRRRRDNMRGGQDRNKLRRTTIQLDEDTYLRAKMLSAQLNAPLWAVLSEAVRAALLEQRKFDVERMEELIETSERGC